MSNTLRDMIRTMVGADKRLHELEEHQLAISNQKPFFFAVGFVCVLVLAISPRTYEDLLFLTGLGVAALSAVPGAVLSWKRFSSVLYWIIPLLQFAAIAAIRASSEEYLVGLSLIAVFPVVWLAWFKPNLWAVHAVNFTATLGIVWVTQLRAEETLSLDYVISTLLIPTVLTVIGIFAANVSRSIDAHEDQLVEKDHKLRQAAEESRRHAQLLDAVIETVPVGVVLVDAEGNDLMMNSQQRATHQLGIPDDIPDPREDQLLVFSPDKATPLLPGERPVRRAIDGTEFTNQLIWLGDERRRRALSVSAKRIEDQEGHPAGSVVIFSDVTELVDALEVKDDFLQSVSHELRTPLTSILGYIDFALEEAENLPGAEAIHANLHVAERNACRLLDLVTDLLVTASKPTLNLRNGDLVGVTRSSVDSARPLAESAGIELIDESALTAPGLIDPDRMHQVVDNLVSNAIKYTSDGGTVTVAAWKEHGNLHLRVADDGPGISDDDQREVFGKFFRAASARDSTVPGVGLGLAITKQIVDAHRGSIRVDSTLSLGTTFTVTIPASRARSKSDNATQST